MIGNEITAVMAEVIVATVSTIAADRASPTASFDDDGGDGLYRGHNKTTFFGHQPAASPLYQPQQTPAQPPTTIDWTTNSGSPFASTSIQYDHLHHHHQQQQQQHLHHHPQQQQQLPQQLGIDLEAYCAQLQFRAPATFQDQMTRVIYTLLMPVVCVLGSIGATICIVVFTRRQMRSSLSVYLAGLSAFDLILLLMSLIIYPSMNICLQEGHHGAVCHFFWRSSLATYPLSLIAQTGSVWTCVAITVDRFLAVQYPLHTRAWCTPRRARIVLNCIAVVAALYKMPSVFELSLDECGRLRPTQLRNHSLYIIIYNTYGYLLLLLVIPFFTIIVLNVVIVNAVRAANVRRRQMRGGGGGGGSLLQTSTIAHYGHSNYHHHRRPHHCHALPSQKSAWSSTASNPNNGGDYDFKRWNAGGGTRGSGSCRSCYRPSSGSCEARPMINGGSFSGCQHYLPPTQNYHQRNGSSGGADGYSSRGGSRMTRNGCCQIGRAVTDAVLFAERRCHESGSVSAAETAREDEDTASGTAAAAGEDGGQQRFFGSCETTNVKGGRTTTATTVAAPPLQKRHSSHSGFCCSLQQNNVFNGHTQYHYTTSSGSSTTGGGGGTTPTATTTISGSSSSSWDYEKRCTKMAIVTIVTFVLFNWLAGVNNVIEAFDLDVSGNAYRIPIGNLLVCLNSATNILIYSIFGQRFRKLCAALLCPCVQRKYDPLSRSC